MIAKKLKKKTDDQEEVDKSPKEKGTEQESTITTRLGKKVTKPIHYLAVIKISTGDWKELEADKAIKRELKMLFQELKALKVVKNAMIGPSSKILFVVAKYLASGEYNKMKAWLVADGRDQDPDLYPNKSSPMVAVHSVFTILGLVPANNWRITVKIDIKSAFMQKPMEGEPTYMQLNRKMTKYVIELFLKRIDGQD